MPAAVAQRCAGRSEGLLGASWSSWWDRTLHYRLSSSSKVLMVCELAAGRKDDPCFDIDWDAAGKDEREF